MKRCLTCKHHNPGCVYVDDGYAPVREEREGCEHPERGGLPIPLARSCEKWERDPLDVAMPAALAFSIAVLVVLWDFVTAWESIAK